MEDLLSNLHNQNNFSLKCRQIICGEYGQDQKVQNGADFLSASCSVTLIEDANLKVLVDCCSLYEKDKLIQALTEADVVPAEITHLIITHWHSDHCGNIALFPNSILVTPQDYETFISPNIYVKVFPGHSALDLVVCVTQHHRLDEGLKRVVIIAGDLFECADDWLGEEPWKLSSMLPGCQAIARVLCWKEADVIVPGHGPAFFSPGHLPPLQNPLPFFDCRMSGEGKATVTKLTEFTSQPNGHIRNFSVFLIRSESLLIVVNTGERHQHARLLNALENEGVQPQKVTHVVITSMGTEFCANLCMFENAIVFMYNDVSITGSFYTPFKVPAMSITSDVFVWKNFAAVDQGKLSVIVNNSLLTGKFLVIRDEMDESLLKYLEASEVEVLHASE